MSPGYDKLDKHPYIFIVVTVQFWGWGLRGVSCHVLTYAIVLNEPGGYILADGLFVMCLPCKLGLTVVEKKIVIGD